ncbi:MAG TPA: beta-propeller fold lactonase family protein [Verrucomicrobiae bacterium]|nr:beta-propeller fold lactonase family protein [Verrucomicrobiae bacterium]
MKLRLVVTTDWSGEAPAGHAMDPCAGQNCVAPPTDKAPLLWLLVLLAVLTPVVANSTPMVCVSNERSGNVTLIDGQAGQVLTTISVGKRPRGIHPSPDGRLLFVALSGSPIGGPRHQGPGTVDDDDNAKKADHSADGIGIIDLGTRKFLRKIPAGSDPEQFAVSADGSMLYVSNEDAGLLSVLNAADGKVEQSIPVGEEPEGVAFSPDGRFVYVTCETRGEIFVIDTKENKSIGHFIVGGRPRNVAFLPDGSRAFIPSESTGVLHVVDTADRSILGQVRLPPNSRPMGLAMTTDGKTLYVSMGWAGTVCSFDTGRQQVTHIIKVGPRPWGIALSPDGQTLYVANGPSNDLSVVDLAAGKEARRIKVGASPWGVAVVP